MMVTTDNDKPIRHRNLIQRLLYNELTKLRQWRNEDCYHPEGGRGRSNEVRPSQKVCSDANSALEVPRLCAIQIHITLHYKSSIFG